MLLFCNPRGTCWRYISGSPCWSLTRCPLCAVVGGEDDDHRGGDLRPLLAAVPRLLHRDGPHQVPEQVEVHPAGVPVSAVAGHELHHVQPHHLLLSE